MLDENTKTGVDKLLLIIVNSTINLPDTSTKHMLHSVMKQCGVAQGTAKGNKAMCNLSIK